MIRGIEDQFRNDNILEMIGDTEKYPEPQIWIPKELMPTLRLCGFVEKECVDNIIRIVPPKNESWEVVNRSLMGIIDWSNFSLKNSSSGLEYMIDIYRDDFDGHMDGQFRLESEKS